jgi:8-oxo-dGTP pyrophosphatase MutT (NUDIX family)
MRKAARAIVFNDGKILVMHRNKYGSQYYTLVGGRITDTETPEQGLVREIKEETGLTVTAGRLVYIEEHIAPYNEQYVYLCDVAPHSSINIQESSEEGDMNKYGMNIHTPQWVTLQAFASLPFRTPQLQEAIVKAFKKGFPKEPVKL